MNRSPRTLLGLLIITGTLVALSGCGWSGFKASRTMSMTVAHLPASALIVESRNGRIDVVRDAAIDEVQITATLRARASTQAEADARVAAATIDAARDTDDSLHIGASFPGGHKSGDGATITVRIPDVAATRIKTSNGRVAASGLSGTITINTSNGSIDLTDHDGPSTVKTSNGSVTLTDAVGETGVVTSNGSVRLVNHGGTADVATSNGRIDIGLRDDQAGPIAARTSNGTIVVRLGVEFAGEVAYRTSNGSVKIEDPSSRIGSWQQKSKNSGSLHLGDSTVRSVVSTSNGSIRIEVASPVAAAGAVED